MYIAKINYYFETYFAIFVFYLLEFIKSNITRKYIIQVSTRISYSIDCIIEESVLHFIFIFLMVDRLINLILSCIRLSGLELRKY